MHTLYLKERKMHMYIDMDILHSYFRIFLTKLTMNPKLHYYVTFNLIFFAMFNLILFSLSSV